MNTNRWTALIVGSSVLAVIAAIAETGNALSMVPILWFLAVIPGLPYMRMLRSSGEPMTLWIAAIGLSLAIDTVVAEALLYTETYTATAAIVVLAVIAVTGAVIGRLRTAGEASEPAETATVTAER